jgi:hypothetical protein
MNNYEKYAIIDSQIRELTEKKEALRVDIVKEMVEKGEKKVESGVGSFTISKLKKWDYSDKIKSLAEKLKADKAKEESCGIATYTEKESLRFTQLKI